MTINIKQDGDGSAGLVGIDGGFGEFEIVNFPYIATSVDQTIFTTSRSYRLRSIIVRPDVIGSDGGAVTITIRKAASGTAITAGTALHTGTGNLKGTANTNQVLTLSATDADLTIPAGTSIVADFGGILTAAVGTVSIALCPL